MSQHLASLKLQDSIDVSGPWGMNTYLGKGECACSVCRMRRVVVVFLGMFQCGRKKVHAKNVAMVAGGTGTTIARTSGFSCAGMWLQE